MHERFIQLLIFLKKKTLLFITIYKSKKFIKFLIDYYTFNILDMETRKRPILYKRMGIQNGANTIVHN
jgi:hypothetical protein